MNEKKPEIKNPGSKPQDSKQIPNQAPKPNGTYKRVELRINLNKFFNKT